MIIKVLQIQNYRGVRSARLTFSRRTLLVGPNNVGKSTILDALDLLLNPERSTRPSAVREHDFHGGRYVDDSGKPVEVRIEAVMTELTEAAERRFKFHLEWWDEKEEILLSPADLTPEQLEDASRFKPALRLGFRAFYDHEEDEFRSETFFAHPPPDEGEDPEGFGRADKRLCGWVFLRARRTGSRALSLERGTLLDLLFQLSEARPHVWDKVLEELRGIGGVLRAEGNIRGILEQLESAVRRYMRFGQEETMTFEVTELTRDSLRHALSLFTCKPASEPIPFTQSGAGTVNVLVLALLTLVAQFKETVVFAMEEPEIALPPHTQRRIVRELQKSAGQCIITSHSPYVAECFLPHEIRLLRARNGELSACPVDPDPEVSKKLRQEMRGQFSEALLGRAVLAVEGETDKTVFAAASEVLANGDSTYIPLEVSGVTILDARGAMDLPKLGRFFRSLGLRTYAFSDKTRAQVSSQLTREIHQAFDCAVEHSYHGMEKLLAYSLPVEVILRFADEAQKRSDYPKKVRKITLDTEEQELRKSTLELLKARKGWGYAARLVSLCSAEELPRVITGLLRQIAGEMSSA